jgi:tape measure domain-containing protein
MSKGAINLPVISKFDPTGLRQAQTAVGKFGDALKGIGLAAFATASAAAIGGIGVAITKGFGRLQQIENARNLLQGIGNDAATVERIMDSALASVKGTAFGLGDAAQVAATATAAGIDAGQEMTDYLTLIADVATVTQAPLSEIGDIFNKITTVGKAQNDTLRQLAERGIPVYQYLADELGITADEVFNLASAGQISADILQDALGNQVAGAALTAGNTVEGAFANVGAAISRIGANLLETTYEQLPQFLQGFIDVLEPLEGLASDVGEQLGSAMEPVFATLLEIFPELVQGLMPLVSLFGELFRTVLPPLLNVFAKLAPIIGRIAQLFADALVSVMPIVVDLFERMWPVLEEVFNALMPVVEEALPVFVELFQLAVDLLMPLVETVLPVLAEMFALFVPVILELVQAFLPLVEALLPPILEIFTALAPVLLALIEAFLPLIEVTLPILVGLIEILTPILEWLAELFSVLLVHAIDSFMYTLGLLTPFMQALAEHVAEGWYQLQVAIVSVINSVGPKVVTWANTVVKGVNRIIQALNVFREVAGDPAIREIGEIGFTALAMPERPTFSWNQQMPNIGGAPLTGRELAEQRARWERQLEQRQALANVPRMAEGGFVDSQTLAIIGEAGPEMVVPLDRMPDLFPEPTGSTVNYSITVNAGLGTDGAAVGREIVAQIKRYERTSGRVFASA